MITEELLLLVVTKLGTYAAEPSVLLRKAQLTKYVDATPWNEKRLVMLILSFQISDVITAHTPKFNTIEFTEFTEHLSVWMSNPSKQNFSTLPYLVQQVLYYMSSVQALRLTAEDITQIIGNNYVDPYDWLVDNVRIQEVEHVCHLCGIQVSEIRGEVLCEKCTQSLVDFTDYRCEQFTLTLSPANFQPVPINNYGDFSITHKQYEITRTSLHEISYKPKQNLVSPQQLELPISEYQKKI